MAEPSADARIRDLKRRLELDPASRLFVSLAEEYRKAGRSADALITLQQGLRNHPGYISAQVALGRAYREAGNVSESIATFTKVLTADPGNLVSAKSLADIFLSRGESVEAIKRYKLYRALSGDRTVDDIVARLEKEIGPPAPRASRSAEPATLLVPPTFFEETPAGPAARPSHVVKAAASDMPTPLDEVFSKETVFPLSAEPLRDPVSLPSERPTDKMEPPAEPQAEPQGRALADLYFAQGHYSEALEIYDELVAAHPFEAELKALRRDAEARLLPAGSAPGAGGAEPGLQRRLARIRALKEWLSVVQAG
ncbi:MAG TPA: tetratricopeptide repeat protein [Thermoanaerobaculia bacterium]|nr:tetratricopeptide repeat protein [Thermoanaerobaculia bacterium]